MQLLDVPRDVLLIVLSFCTIEELLSLEQTCRSMVDIISCSRLPWLRSLSITAQEKLPHITPHSPLSTFSTATLKSYAVSGLRRWSNWNRSTGPIPRRTTVLNTVEHSWSVYMAKLTPCGCHLLVQRLNYIDCWDLKEKKIVWRMDDPAGKHMPFFGYWLAETNVLLIARTGFTLDRLIFQVVRLDMETMQSEVVMERLIPYRPVAFRPAIFGDIAIVPLCEIATPEISRAWVMNWRTGECLFLDIHNALQSSRKVCGVGVAQENILYISADGTRLNAIPMSALDRFWCCHHDPVEWPVYTLPAVSPVSLQLPIPELDVFRHGNGADGTIQRTRSLTNFTVHATTWNPARYTPISLMLEDRDRGGLGTGVIPMHTPVSAALFHCSLMSYLVSLHPPDLERAVPECEPQMFKLELLSSRRIPPRRPNLSSSPTSSSSPMSSLTFSSTSTPPQTPRTPFQIRLSSPPSPPTPPNSNQSLNSLQNSLLHPQRQFIPDHQRAVLITVHGSNVLMSTRDETDLQAPITITQMANDVDEFADALLLTDNAIAVVEF